DLSDDGLRVRHVKEVGSRDQVESIVQDEFAREAQVEKVHAWQTLDSRGLQDDGLADVNALAVRNVESFGRLQRIAGIVLEVDARADFPGEFVGSVDFKNVSRIEVEVVVVSIDVVVGI